MARNADGASYYEIRIDNARLRIDAKQAENILAGIGDKAVAEGARIDNAFKKFILPAGATIAVQQFSRSLVQVRGEMKALEDSFKVLLSGKGVDGFISQLKQFAVDSPLSLPGVSAAAQTLLGFNVETERVIPVIRQLGDVSMGNEEKFRSLALAYAQVHSTGKLMGQDLLQMINAGFNPLTVIAEKTGKSVGVLKEEMAAGAISAQMVADAFASATAEGGKFHGMTQTQAEGIKGLEAQLGGVVQEAFNNIGKSQEGIITGSYKAAIAIVENYEKVGKIVIGLVATYGAYRAAVIVATAAEKGWTIAQLAHYNVLLIVEKAQKLLNKTMLSNPYVLAASLLIGLVATMWALRDSTTAAERAQERLNKRQEEFAQKEQERRSRIEELIRIIQDETQTTYAQIKAYEELQKLSPALIQAYTREQLAVAELADTTKALNVEQDKINADHLVFEIENARKAIVKLKEEWQLMASMPEQSPIMLKRLARQIEDQEAGLVILQKNLADHNRRVAEAEFNALPPAEKIKIKEEQLAKIRSEFDKVNSVINEELAKLPQEVRIPFRVEVTGGGQQTPEFQPYSTQGTMWSAQGIGVKQARADALRSEASAVEAEIAVIKTANDTKKQLSDEERKRLEAEAKRRREQAKKDAETVAKLTKQLADDAAQAEVDAMADGYLKKRAQAKLEFEREKADIISRQEELKALQKGVLTDEQNAYFASLTRGADSTYAANVRTIDKEAFSWEAEETAWREYLIEYGNYEEKRLAITEKYAELISKAKTLGEGESLAKQRNKELSDLIERYKSIVAAETGLASERVQVSNKTYLFQSDKEKKILEIQKLGLETRKKLIAKQIEETGATDELNQELAETNVQLEGVNNQLENLSNEKTLEVLNGFRAIADELGQIDGVVGNIFSNIAGQLDNILVAFDKSASGVDRISAGVSGLVNIISMISSASANRKQAEKEFYENQIALAHEYALALNEQLRIQSELSGSSFVTDYAGQINDAFAALTDATANYNDAIAKLADGKAKTDLRNSIDWGNVGKGAGAGAAAGAAIGSVIPVIGTAIGAVIGAIGGALAGLFGGKKKKEVFGGLLEVFPELVDEAGNLNTELAQTLINTNQVDDSTKQLIQNAIDWEAQIEAANEQIKDIAASLAGDIGNTLQSAIVDAWKAGEDGAESMFDAAGKSLEGFVEKLLYSTIFSDVFKEFEDKLAQALKGDADILDAYDWLMSQMQEKDDAYLAYLDAFKKRAEQRGYEMWQAEEDTSQREGSSRGFETASQDSVSELNGRFTAMQVLSSETLQEVRILSPFVQETAIHAQNIREAMNNLQDNAGQILQRLEGIEKNTGHLEAISEGIKSIKGSMDDIEVHGVTLKR